MPPFKDDMVQLNGWERFVVRVLRCGPIPRHLAIIMDGNRRYGQRLALKNPRDAYVSGRQTAWYVNSLCRELGVEEVTLYVFSIDNFQRSPEELTTLLDEILPDTLQRALDQRQMYQDQGVRVRVIGNTALLSPRIRDLINKVEEATKQNSRFVVNMAMSYTSRDEISTAIRNVVTSHTPVESITEKCVTSHLHLSSDVDCLIRTSGELRFSDFLLWQLHGAFVNIHKRLWPEFGLTEFVVAIIEYQRSRAYLNRYRGSL